MPQPHRLSPMSLDFKTYPGSAMITGTGILENGRIVDRSKPFTLTFDAHIFVPGKGQKNDEILAVISLFSPDENKFADTGR